MTEPRIIALFDDYAGLIASARARVAELGMTYETLDQVIGWGDTRSTKYLCTPPPQRCRPDGKPFTQRNLSPRALEELVKGIAVKIAFVHDEVQLARVKRHRDFKVRSRPVKPMLSPPKHEQGAALFPAPFLQSMGKLGGEMRAKKLTAGKRRKIARKAARARWRGNRPKAVDVT